MAELSRDELEAAALRGDARMRGPRAESVHYDASRHRIFIMLTSGTEIAFDPSAIEGLRTAVPDDLAEIEIQEFGLGLHFPKLEADLYLPALLNGVFGSRRWIAAQLGAAGGRTRSAEKAAAARENGKRGGRPRKAKAH